MGKMMLDHLLEMPDDEPMVWTECPNCLCENEHERWIPEISCTECKEIFKISFIDNYDFCEECYDY